MVSLRTVLAASICASIIVLSGCAAQSAVEQPTPDQTAPSATSPGAATPAAPIGQMPLDTRKTELPPDFPLEIPVPDGRVLSAEQQGPDVWLYEIALGAPVADVAAYYERAYAGANWSVARRSGDAASASLLFVKGEAEATVDVRADEAGSRAAVAVGLGVPVGSTY